METLNFLDLNTHKICMSAKQCIKKVSDPIKLIEGGLSAYKGKKTSVELQHEATRTWAKKINPKNIK